jgi:cell division protein FtsI/penicillin-binding protein 2
MSFNPRARIRLLAAGFLALALLFVARLFFFQIIRGDHYAEESNRQYLKPAAGLFNRGTIFFTERTGALISAATIKTGFILSINPTLVNKPEETYEALTAILPLERESFLTKAAKPNDLYEEIASRLDESTAKSIIALNKPGVSVVKDRFRFYPAGTLSAHAIGLMGFRGNDYLGRYGLERRFESVLSRSQSVTFVNFFAELFSGLKAPDGVPSGRGDIVTAIEPAVATHLESLLDELMVKWQAVSGGGIVMDPFTGEIVAMAARPAFSPGERQRDINVLTNPLVENVFEMGSIIKPLTLAAGIDAEVITPETVYFDDGQITIDGARIANYDGRSRGYVPMQEVLNQSLNTGAVYVMRQLGQDRLRQYFLDFGLGEKTGIDLPDETSGLVDNLDGHREVEYATASFGQGIAFSPVATIRALSSLANGGTLVRPHLVREIHYETKLVEKIKPNIGPRVLKPETSETITAMLVRTVDEALLGGSVRLPRFRVAAKTGTAQIPAPGGGYWPDRFLHSFFGYFPAFEPRFIIFFYLNQPLGARFASETLTYPFMDMTRFLLHYYSIPPDR